MAVFPLRRRVVSPHLFDGHVVLFARVCVGSIRFFHSFLPSFSSSVAHIHFLPTRGRDGRKYEEKERKGEKTNNRNEIPFI